MNYYHGKTVLLTGAFGGLGLQFVEQLLQSGARLILTDVTTRQVSAVAGAQGRESQILGIIASDLSGSEGCNQLYSEVSSLGVVPDVIVHNAGIVTFGALVDLPPEMIEKVMQVNLVSIAVLNRLFLPEMIRRGSGHLIYVASVAGFVATPFAVPYSSTKFGLRGLGMALHGEVKKQGIRTSITCPFYTKTPIMQSAVFGKPEMVTMPDYFAGDPADVVRTTLNGAARGKLLIYPGFFSKALSQAVRFMPVIARQRFMRDELIEDQGDRTATE